MEGAIWHLSRHDGRKLRWPYDCTFSSAYWSTVTPDLGTGILAFLSADDSYSGHSFVLNVRSRPEKKRFVHLQCIVRSRRSVHFAK